MKSKYILSLFSCIFLFLSNTAVAQLVSDNVFMQGRWLEACIAPNGSWGNTVTIPAAYHTNPFFFISGYTDPVTGVQPPTTTAIDFSYDVGHDGWTTGAVPFYGPYFMPGTPFDGWAMQVNGVRSDAWYTNFGYWNAAGGTLTGNVSGYTQVPAGCNQSPSMAIGTWTGTAGPGNALHITQSNRLDTNASWIIVTVKYVNTSATAMTGLYYWVSGDPDNDEVLTSGSYPTNDHISYQGDAENRHEVNSRPPSLHQDAFSGLATKDCRAKAHIYVDWTSTPPELPGQTLDQVYNETATWLNGSFYSVDTTTFDEDWAMGLIFNLGDLAPGDSTVLSYAWIFSDTSAIDSAFPGPILSTGGVLHSGIDTVSACTIAGCGVSGSTFIADIIGGDDKDWSQSTWSWSPSTGLSTTTGTHVTVNMSAVTTPTTYTIVGTKDVAHGQCGTTILYLYVDPCFTASTNGPCPGDALTLEAHGGDSTGAIYYWYGPGGFTSTMQNPIIGSIISADTGIYTVVKTVGTVHDTASVHVVLAYRPTVTAGGSSPICAGDNISLTAGPDTTGETFTWSGPGGFSSGSEDPTITGVPVTGSGTYTVVASYFGCTDTSTVNVTVNPTPAVPVLGSNSPICAGATLNLTATDATTGAITYHWSGPGGFVSLLQDPSVTAASTTLSGTYSVTATLGSCTSSATITITVNPLPTAPVLGSNTPVCSGNVLNLTATDITGSTYSWAGPNSFSSTLENPSISSVTTAASGTYTVVATFASCVSPASTETIVIDSTPVVPVVTSNSPICAATALFLTSSDVTTGVTFSWAGPLAYTSTLQNPTISSPPATASGVYTVTATLGICSSFNTVSVTVNPIPAPPTLGSLAPLCSGNALDLTATDATGATYNWAGPNGFSSTLQNPVIDPASISATGTYSVVATLAGCTSLMSTEFVTIDSTPVIPTIIGSNSPICAGDTLFLTSSSPTSGVSYSWTGPLAYSSPIQDPFIANPPATASGNYTVTVTLGTCSSFTVTPVLVKPVPALTSLASNAPLCSGNTLIFSCLFAPTGGAYNWTGPNGFVSAIQNPSITSVTTLATGTYSVYEALNGCVSDTATVFVEIDSTPQVPVLSNNSPGAPGPSICYADTLQFTSADGTAGVGYSWVGPNSFTSTIQDPSITDASLAAIGEYTLTVTLGLCNAVGVTSVSIKPAPPVTATNNGPLCTGVQDTLLLQAASSPGATFVWAGPYTFSSLNQNPYRSPVIAEYGGVYQVTATLGGCTSTVNDTVVIRNTPATPTVNWLTYCQFYSASPLQAMGDSILWYTNATGANGSLVPPVPSTTNVGVSWFYASQTLGNCTSFIDSIKVTVNPKPLLTISNDTTVCPHDSVVLKATDTDPLAYYYWSPGLYLNSTSTTTVVAKPETNIRYTVVANNQFGCSDTASVNVTVLAAAVLNLGDSIVLYPGESTQIIPQTNCSVFSWFPPYGLDNPYSSSPFANPDLSTEYKVHAATSWGCTADDSIGVYINSDAAFGIPNAFTPGNGPNNEFKIIQKGVATLKYFRVFDRWGVKVFETTSVDDGWDGSYNGVPQPFGVYIYQVEAITANGRTISKQGNVTLLR